MNGDVACVIPAREGNCRTVTLFSHFGNYPPVDPAGLIGYASTPPATDTFEVVRYAEPLDDGLHRIATPCPLRPFSAWRICRRRLPVS